MRNFHIANRSAVYGSTAMVSTSCPQATFAARDMLKSGGNAVDAVLTAAAVTSVIEPAMTGIGGDCFAIVSKPGDDLAGYNGSGWSPAGVDVDAIRDAGSFTNTSAHAVTIPGAIDGWCALHARYGSRPMDEILVPAIAAARDGYLVTPRVAFDWAASVEKLSGNAVSKAVFLAGGKAPVAGDKIQNAGLATALERVAEHGRAGFYEGETAADLVATLQALGGAHNLDDFAEYEGEWAAPLTSDFAGETLCELPPNGTGVIAQMIVNILEQAHKLHGVPDQLSAKRYHLLLEAQRLAWHYRNSVIGDPRFETVPADALLGDGFAAKLAEQIDISGFKPEKTSLPAPKMSDTTYIACVDADGMAVSFINSVFQGFGSGITGETTGVVLQNRGFAFNLEAGHPNCLAPRKRSLHTIIPGMMMSGDKASTVFGVMGGAYQPVGHATVLANMYLYGDDPQQALDAPRAFYDVEAQHLDVEDGMPADIVDGLKDMGYAINRPDEAIGGGQIIRINNETGVLVGGSDPRKDGCAAGW